MKGLSTTMVIVITVIVVLIAALIVLTIFGGVIGNVGTLIEARNSCSLEWKASCETARSLPLTWGLFTKNVQGEGLKSCADLLACNLCPNAQGTGTVCSF